MKFYRCTLCAPIDWAIKVCSIRLCSLITETKLNSTLINRLNEYELIVREREMGKKNIVVVAGETICRCKNWWAVSIATKIALWIWLHIRCLNDRMCVCVCVCAVWGALNKRSKSEIHTVVECEWRRALVFTQHCLLLIRPHHVRAQRTFWAPNNRLQL